MYVCWSPATLDDLREVVYNLFACVQFDTKSSLYACVKELRRQISIFIKSEKYPSPTQKLRLDLIITKLKKFSGTSQESSDPTDSFITRLKGKKILIADSEKTSAALMQTKCEFFGCITHVIHELNNFQAEIQKFDPNIIMVDVAFPEGVFAGVDAVTNYQTQTDSVAPVIFVSSRADLSARMEVLRTESFGFLRKPASTSDLITQLYHCSFDASAGKKIMVLDGDKDFLQSASLTLKQAGYTPASSSKPLNIIADLDRHQPDALIINLELPRVQGDVILQILRHDSRYADLPIIPVTDIEQKEQVALEGGVATLPKSVFLDNVSGLLDTLIEQNRSMLAKNDAIEKLQSEITNIDREYFILRMQYELDQSTSRNDYVSALVSVSLQNLEQIRRLSGFKNIRSNNKILKRIVTQSIDSTDVFLEVEEFRFLLILRANKPAALKSKVELLHNKMRASGIGENTGEGADEGVFQPAIGSVLLNGTSLPVDDLIVKANALCSQAIATGKSVVFDKLQILQLKAIHQNEDIVRRAISDAQLRAFFQPIESFDGDTYTVEALARICNSENESLLAPDEFLPIVLKNNLQDEFNNQVLASITAAIGNLGDKDSQKVRVIFKPLTNNYHCEDLIRSASEGLKNIGLDGNKSIIFSVPEEILINNPPLRDELRGLLKDNNLDLLIEDAGAAEFSLKFLKEFQADHVKLCKYLVDSVAKERVSAKNRVEDLLKINKSIIAPFIEDATTFSSLWSLGIRRFQGYFVDQPKDRIQIEQHESIPME